MPCPYSLLAVYYAVKEGHATRPALARELALTRRQAGGAVSYLIGAGCLRPGPGGRLEVAGLFRPYRRGDEVPPPVLPPAAKKKLKKVRHPRGGRPVGSRHAYARK